MNALRLAIRTALTSFERLHLGVKTLIVFTFFIAVYSTLYFTLASFGTLDDPYFHIRLAELIRERGLGVFRDFPWLYFSDIRDDQQYFVYYNFAFYFVLIPFTYFDPLAIGIKLYGVVFGALSIAIVYYFLRRCGVQKAWVWVLIFFVFYTDLRIVTMRPFALAPFLLLLFLLLLRERKYWLVFLLSFFYFYWHTATFFFPLMLAVLYVAFQDFYNDKRDLKLIYATVGGSGLALLLCFAFAPGLFAYMKEVIIGVLYETIIFEKVKLAEGVELYPLEAIYFPARSFVMYALFVLPLVFEIALYILRKRKPVEWKELDPVPAISSFRSTLFFLSLLFLFGSFLSQRNLDFFRAFGLVYAGFSVPALLSTIRYSSAYIRAALARGGAIILLTCAVSTFFLLYDAMSNRSFPHHIQGAALWIKKNVPPHEVIFHPTWNWFTTLFYFDPDHYYIIGLEPRFLYLYSPSMYWTWWNLSVNGYVCRVEKCPDLDSERVQSLRQDEEKEQWAKEQGDSAARVISETFQSRFVITSPQFSNFNVLLENNTLFKLQFEDPVSKFKVYEIIMDSTENK